MPEFSEDLQRAKEGHESAIRRIYDEYSPDVLRVVRRRCNGMLRRLYDSADLAQSVFLELLKDLPRLDDRGPVAFRRLLGIKAENKVRMKYRKHLKASGGRREQTLADHDRSTGSPGPLTMALRREEAEAVRAAVSTLSERHREVLLLRSVERQSHAEVAARMDLPTEDAARRLHARALLKLSERWMRQ